MSWYRKYRPQKISDLNLIKVRDSFLKMLESGKIPQSLLFAGPKGTGKTSSSRIIGALLNDKSNADLVDVIYFGKNKKLDKKNSVLVEPDTATDFAQKVYRGQSFIVQEMDAASNRGIDDVRSLKERVMMPPQEGKMAVYILDEVHMFTNDAFNALLKILEEPPQHVVFILATTELHKLPPTIVSRCTVINFYRASNEEIVEALKNIIKAEKISIDDQFLFQIADFADGSFRDAVKILEQTCQSGKFSSEVLDLIMDSSIFQSIKEIIKSVLDKDEVFLVSAFQDLRKKDINQNYFYKSLFAFLHLELMKSIGVEKGECFSSQVVIRYFLSQLLEINLDLSTPIPFLPLEIKFLEIIEKAKSKNSGQKNNGGNNTTINNIKKNDSTKKKANSASLESKTSQESYISRENIKLEKEGSLIQTSLQDDAVIFEFSSPLKKTASNSNAKALLEKWDDFVRTVNQHNSSLGALLRSSQPIQEREGRIEVGVYYRFHQEQLKNPKFKDIYNNCTESLFGERFDFEFVLREMPEEVVGLTQPSSQLEEKILSSNQKNLENDGRDDEKVSLVSMASKALM